MYLRNDLAVLSIDSAIGWQVVQQFFLGFEIAFFFNKRIHIVDRGRRPFDATVANLFEHANGFAKVV